MNRRRLLLAGLSAAAVAASPLFAQQAPVEQVERTRLAKGHWMETRATVSRTGRVDVKTSTWSANEGSGFHGAVVVFLLDRDHNRLHSTEPKTFGVNSKLLPGSHRDELFHETIPVDVARQTHAIVIEHLYRPESEVLDRLRDASEASRYLSEIVSNGAKILLVAVKP